MIQVATTYPLAFDSPDYTHPHGTMRDNTFAGAFLPEVERYFSKKICFMDLGTAGGRLPLDFHFAGHLAVGLEGSDYNLRRKDGSPQNLQWIDYYNKILFTCDISRPFTVLNRFDLVKFDLITAWEVMEHIHPDRFNVFAKNITYHLKDDGFFVGSISTVGDASPGVELHQSLYTQEVWMNEILPTYFTVEPYPFQTKCRDEANSFFVKLTTRIAS